MAIRLDSYHLESDNEQGQEALLHWVVSINENGAPGTGLGEIWLERGEFRARAIDCDEDDDMICVSLTEACERLAEAADSMPVYPPDAASQVGELHQDQFDDGAVV